MQCHRVNELSELLTKRWLTEPNLQLVELLQQIAGELKVDDVSALTDDQLIYHLKVSPLGKDEVIPGIAKDYEEDFKAAILKARGILPNI